MPVLRTAGKAVVIGARGTRVVAKGMSATASGGARAGRWIGRSVNFARHRGGANSIGMMRLLDLHAVSCAGDTLVTIGLAGTIFFSVPVGEARSRVGLYLFITMVPFALLAPVVGPVLDRFRHGRRFALATTMLGRAVLAWVIADNVAGIGLYPAAFGVLALSRAYGVARSAAVPRLLPPGLNLSQAGARASVFGTVAGALVAPLGAAAFWFGAQWPLRIASLIFLVGMLISFNLPPRADSDPPESPPRIFQVPWRHRVGAQVTRPLSGRLVTAALGGSSMLRALYGFLLLFLAFAIRSGELPTGILGLHVSPAGALGMVGGALALGTFVSTAIGTRLHIRRPVLLQTTGLAVVLMLAMIAALSFRLYWVLALCLGTAIASGLAKLSLDAVIQERVPETVRASAFAHSETLLMLAWVFGGAFGLIPFGGRVGVGLVAVPAAAAVLRTGILTWRLRGDRLRGTDIAGTMEAELASGRGQPHPDRYGASSRDGHGSAPGAGGTADRLTGSPAASGSPADPAGPRSIAASRHPGASPTGVMQENGESPPGFHIFRPSPPDTGVSDPRSGA